MQHWHRVAALGTLALCICLGADIVDRTLDDAKHAHQAELARAQAELDKAQAKFRHDAQLADAKLMKAYDDAIKRTTQKGDLEGANKLLAEKKQLASPDATDAGATPNAETSGAQQLHWTSLSKDGNPQAGFLVTDIAAGAKEADYLKYFQDAKLDQKLNDHDVTKIAPSAEGTFPDFASHNIQTAYVAFYLQNDASENTTMVIRTTPFGSLHVLLDGKVIIDHGADNKSPFEEKVPLKLRRGKHLLLVRHSNSWADCWFGLNLVGGKLLVGT